MKTLTKIPVIRFLMVLLLPCLLINCKKSDNGTTVTFPAVITQTPSAITDSSASVGGFVTSDGGLAVFERGICFAKVQNPTIADRTVKSGSGTGSYTGIINGLDQGTLYYARAYALNSGGTGYGSQVSFTTTLKLAPVVTTDSVRNITATWAKCSGNVTSEGTSAVTAKGICWGTSHSPAISGDHTVDGSGGGVFTSTVTPLNPATVYYIRAYATNSIGTSYGTELSFTSGALQPPSVTTDSVNNIGQTAASCYGDVISEGTSAVTARGFCWGTSHNPAVAGNHTTNGSGGGVFTGNIQGLSSGTVYYVRAYATNTTGTSYGLELSFTTAGPETVTDIDGNVYHVVTFGTQVWMVENLKTTRFNDGSAIPNVTDAYAWCLQTGPGYCWYNNDHTAYGNPYGAIYNFYAASSGKLAPAGWHVPTHAEWTTLTDYLGGAAVAGGKMKEAGTSHWTYPNTGADNSSGFTALPGGYRSSATGEFHNVGMDGYYWTSSESVPPNAFLRYFYYQSAAVSYRSNASLNDGFPVRCIKD
ncbi:MAG: fibrobacter succinogenes major paralogous domain-containing protein [Bacteroidota bacterium]